MNSLYTKNDKIVKYILIILLLISLSIFAMNRVIARQSGDNQFMELTQVPTFVPPPTPQPPNFVEIEAPPATLVIISESYDLAPDIPDKEKMVYVVRRSNGENIAYFVSDAQIEQLDLLLGLNKGDKITNSYPLVLLRSTPHIRPTDTATLPPPTQTPLAYPLPSFDQ